MTKDNSLEKARRTINEVDARMRELFVERMRAVELVAEYKKERGMAIFDPAREAEIIKRQSELLEDDTLREYYVSFLKNNMVYWQNFSILTFNGLSILGLNLISLERK